MANDLPELSGRFEADPFSEDCKDIHITIGVDDQDMTKVKATRSNNRFLQHSRKTSHKAFHNYVD